MDGQREKSSNTDTTSKIQLKERLTSLFEPGSSHHPAPMIQVEKQRHHPHQPAAPEEVRAQKK
ncbi:hypothetical protein TSAR_000528 [Trichomalopsis sarcophagae]|uniref:Uncharacterized protein n=1 Tax=Trichomalopsis sarcophagae TaxID=543379 RepID=A0A232FJK6_9HYME|nr:hypothetical protein TSAR_000528 [Trichomalopsis sarcophagae]